MNADKIKELLNKIPISLLLGIFLASQAWDYYDFMNNPVSPFLVKKAEIMSAKEVRKKLDQKLKEANEFVKSLEKKKSELRKLAIELQGMKETLSDRLDIPTFMKMTITESKKLGITVISLKPFGTVNKEYYTEQNFKFEFRGIFAQVASFMERLTNVAEIVRVDTFSMKPIATGRGKFVLLDVTIEMKTYKYLGSTADKLGANNDPLTGLGGTSKPTSGDGKKMDKAGNGP